MNALRRGHIKLRSLSDGHSDLNLLIMELKDLKTSSKNSIRAHRAATQRQAKWAVNDQGGNGSVQTAASQTEELGRLFEETMATWLVEVRRWRESFESILTAEKRVDNARAAVKQAEAKLKKVQKEKDKDKEKKDIASLEAALRSARTELSAESASAGVHKICEFKSSLLGISDAYIDLASKMQILFEAQKDIARQLPEPDDRMDSFHDLGGAGMAECVQIAKNRLNEFERKKTHRQLVQTSLCKGRAPTAPNAAMATFPRRHDRRADQPPPYNAPTTEQGPDYHWTDSRRNTISSGGSQDRRPQGNTYRRNNEW